MRIKVDSEKCEGHNRCYSIAPELFDVDDYGYATEKGDGTVPPELEVFSKEWVSQNNISSSSFVHGAASTRGHGRRSTEP